MLAQRPMPEASPPTMGNMNIPVPLQPIAKPDDSSGLVDGFPTPLPITVDQYECLVREGCFEQPSGAPSSGQIELINGRIVHMNPQGPQHASPIDLLTEWSFQVANHRFRIRIEKAIVLPQCDSCPEPDLAWVEKQIYQTSHPTAEQVFLVIETSVSSVRYDAVVKSELYATAGIPEYWQLDVPSREMRIHLDPAGGRYRSVTTHAASETLRPRCLPEAELQTSSLFEENVPE